jgi:hypothetical protein
MKIIPFLIEKTAKAIIGGVPFESAKTIVGTLNDSNLSNEEKRSQAIEELKSYGYKLAGYLINLAIELAVTYFKEKVK